VLGHRLERKYGQRVVQGYRFADAVASDVPSGRLAAASGRYLRSPRGRPIQANAAAILTQCPAARSSEVEQPASPRDGPLTRAAGEGDLAELRRLLAGGIDIDSTGETGRTAVTAAVYGGHLDAVRLLIDEGADVDIQDEHRTNALLALGETGDVVILREVLGAKPDLTRTNRFGGTALIPAADRGHVEVVRELVRTDIDIDHVNSPGWTALLEAVILGDGGPAHQEIVRTLVAAGATVDLADRKGVTPLEHARSRDFAEIARMLEIAAR
jgi:ankyrin repeat protein